MTQGFRYVGDSDFHDGYVRTISRNQDQLLVIVEGSSGKHYTVVFDGVLSVDSDTPQNMMLYALRQGETGTVSLYHYDFQNWYGDEPEREESKSYLRVIARSFSVTQAD